MTYDEAAIVLEKHRLHVAHEWERSRPRAVFLFDVLHDDCREMCDVAKRRNAPLQCIEKGVYIVSFIPTATQLEWAEEQAGPLESSDRFWDYYVSVGAYWFRRWAIVKGLNYPFLRRRCISWEGSRHGMGRLWVRR